MMRIATWSSHSPLVFQLRPCRATRTSRPSHYAGALASEDTRHHRELYCGLRTASSAAPNQCLRKHDPKSSLTLLQTVWYVTPNQCRRRRHGLKPYLTFRTAFHITPRPCLGQQDSQPLLTFNQTAPHTTPNQRLQWLQTQQPWLRVRLRFTSHVTSKRLQRKHYPKPFLSLLQTSFHITLNHRGKRHALKIYLCCL